MNSRNRWVLGAVCALTLEWGSLLQAQESGILREVYTGIPGSLLSDLTNATIFPDHPSSTNILSDFFETPIDIDEEYGQRLRGFIVPPATGTYLFWIASDDQSSLYLSTDSDPERKQWIAGVFGWTSPRAWFTESSQQSAPLRLEAGRRYYIEALMKEGNGGDNLAVRWQLPNGTIEEPIPASRLIPFGGIQGPPVIVSHPTNTVVLEGATAIFRVRVRSLDGVSFQWYRSGSPIADANASAYTNAVVPLADQGARYSCLVSNLLGVVLSQEATLSVLPDVVAPTIQRVYSLSGTNLMVAYSEPVINATRSGNYALDGGARVLSATLNVDGRSVVLTTTPLLPRQAYVLTVNLVADRSVAANTIAPNTRRAFTPMEFVPVDIGVTTIPGDVIASIDGVRLTAAGRGISGAADQFLFVQQRQEGNFDFRVRLQSLGLSDLWASAGLMARENLGAGSAMAAILATPSASGIFFASRNVSNAPATRTGFEPVNYPATWLRLRRSNDVFTGFASLNGQEWTEVGSRRIGLSNVVYFGYALSSGQSNQVTTAETFDFAPVRGALPAPTPPEALESLGPSSRKTGLVISEIMYHPADHPDGRVTEFVELYNSDLVAEDLSGFRLQGAIDFTFPPGTVLRAGGFLVVARVPEDVRSVYGISDVLGSYNGRLQNTSGSIQLIHKTGALLLDAAYSGAPPWPASADGAGHSLALGRPSYGESDPRAWVASNRIGGSPGRAEAREVDPLHPVKINELLAHTDPPLRDFVELYNYSTTTLDLSGCVLTDDPALDRFTLPAGTFLSARGFLVYDQDRLGFALNAAGETLYLKNPTRTRILDAIRFAGQANGMSAGRYPDGAPATQPLSKLSPGETNAPPYRHDIVINEIMFHPITENADDEFVELLNTGTQRVDLSGWRFTDGIDFTFPPGTFIAPGDYLVLAKRADRLMEAYTNLNALNLIGDYQGDLSDGGERIVLSRPELIWTTNTAGIRSTNQYWVAVDEVTYGDGGRWGKWSDGGGSSLELIDPRVDNRQPASWADSDETGKSSWVTIERSGRLENGHADWLISDAEALLLGAGECLLDDMEVAGAGGDNLVANPGFEGGATGWRFFGNHAGSSLQENEGATGRRSLRLRATGRGDTGPNQVTAALRNAMTPGSSATVRCRARWLKGHPELLVRVHAGYLDATGRLAIPRNLGSPGASNSRAVRNAGPTIFDVRHSPVLPAANQPVVITARVADPDGVASVQLRYRADPSVTINAVTMLDDGAGPDLMPGDGIYSARVNGLAVRHLLAFYVEATDQALPRATATFPAEAPAKECLVVFGEAQPSGNLGTYRLWFTEKTTETWAQADRRGSNDALDATFVYGDSRVVYNMGALYSGSPYHWGSYDHPVNDRCNYAMVFPSDDRFLGAEDFVLNLPSNIASDGTAIREQIFYWMVREMGDPFTYRRFHHMYVNGLWRGPIYEDAQQPNRDFVEQWFPQLPRGELFKIEDWFEYDHNSFGFSNLDATLENVVGSDGEKWLPRYRWMWRKRMVEGSANDYASLFRLVDTVTAELPPEGYADGVERLIDIEQWMRTMALRHMCGDWDAYGYRRGKNMYAYKPGGDRWRLLHWDVAFSFGLGDGVRTDVFDVRHFDGVKDPVTDRMFQTPPFRRMYLQSLMDIARGPMTAERVGPVIDALSGALVAAGINVSSPASIKTWIASRRQFLLQVVATNDAPFSVTSHANGNFSTNRNAIAIEGTAPLEAKTVRVNGIAYPLKWNTLNGWQMQVPLQAGLNRLQLAAYTASGEAITNASQTLDIIVNTTVEAPEDAVVINEILYAPTAEDTEFIELLNTSTISTFDLTGWRLDGVDFDFAEGTLLPPQGFLLVVRDRRAFEAAFGEGLPVAGIYQGRLDRGGETLRLVHHLPDGSFRIIDQVRYEDDPPWPAPARTQGASLQLVDAYVDNDVVGNWRAVGPDDTAASDWQYVVVTAPAQGNWIQLALTQPGDVFIDRLSLVTGAVAERGVNLVRNGGFEGVLPTDWTVSSALAGSSIGSDPVFDGRGALHLVSTQGGLARGNSISQDLAAGALTGGLHTLSYWYRPGSSRGQLSVHVGTSLLEGYHDIHPPARASATPGSANSVADTLDPFPPLVLNEVQPENPGTVRDGAGEADPWLEIWNKGNDPVPLEGMRLELGFESTNVWLFPSSSQIAPGQYLLVWLDGQPNQDRPGEWHTSFQANGGSGSLTIARRQGSGWGVIDDLHYRSVPQSTSFGRTERSPRGEVLVQATPAAANAGGTELPQIRINEWLADNASALADPADGDFDDWFELYNAGLAPVSLAGLTLTDNLMNQAKFVIPAGYIIDPGDYLLVWADEETRQNEPGRALHVNFKLSASGEAIGLYSPAGTLIDSILFGAQKPDLSEGRWPDGGPMAGTLSQPTPGSANQPGTHPQPTVLLTIQTEQAGQIIVRCATTPGNTYQLQFKETLSQQEWRPVGTAVPANGAEVTWSESIAHSERYYRVVQVSGPAQ